MIRTTASIVRRSIDLRAVPSGDGVVASRMEGMAAEDAAEGHSKAGKRAVSRERSPADRVIVRSAGKRFGLP